MNRMLWLERWGLSSLKLTAGFLQAEWKPNDPDRNAAWDLYVELLTRVATQPLNDAVGDEATALDSIFRLFGLTRDILKHHGRSCNEFAKIAIPVLNQILRPFTARWHRISLQKGFTDEVVAKEFRAELATLQSLLRNYAKALADMAGVEDLTELEPAE